MPRSRSAVREAPLLQAPEDIEVNGYRLSLEGRYCHLAAARALSRSSPEPSGRDSSSRGVGASRASALEPFREFDVTALIPHLRLADRAAAALESHERHIGVQRLGGTREQRSMATKLLDDRWHDWPIVLVQNDRTVDGTYDFRDDATGVRYQYQNMYRDRVSSGRRFLYYRGVRGQDGERGVAEYFGAGRIGRVHLDRDAEYHRERWWSCDIEDYIGFEPPVASCQVTDA